MGLFFRDAEEIACDQKAMEMAVYTRQSFEHHTAHGSSTEEAISLTSWMLAGQFGDLLESNLSLRGKRRVLKAYQRAMVAMGVSRITARMLVVDILDKASAIADVPKTP